VNYAIARYDILHDDVGIIHRDIVIGDGHFDGISVEGLDVAAGKG